MTKYLPVLVCPISPLFVCIEKFRVRCLPCEVPKYQRRYPTRSTAEPKATRKAKAQSNNRNIIISKGTVLGAVVDMVRSPRQRNPSRVLSSCETTTTACEGASWPSRARTREHGSESASAADGGAHPRTRDQPAIASDCCVCFGDLSKPPAGEVEQPQGQGRMGETKQPGE